jgi:hypothetical protein
MTTRKIVRWVAGIWLAILSVGVVAQQIKNMPVVGYPDRFSVEAGHTIRLMVLSELPRYRANIVPLIHCDVNPRWPGFKGQLIDSPANREYTSKYCLDRPRNRSAAAGEIAAARR